MPSPRFQVIPSVYVVMLREGAGDPEVLLQLRRGTGYMDGWWACAAAGHVEAGESVLQAAVREAREELGIEVGLDALEPITTMHRHVALSSPMEERYDTFVLAQDWAGEPRVMEADKAADLRWFPLSELPPRTVPHEAQALRALLAARRGGEKVPAVLTRGFEQSLTVVVAVGRNGAIGRRGTLPWHLPGDLKHFKDTTMGGVMVMGRVTYESMGALPGRTSIVMTRDDAFDPGRDSVLVARSWAEALLMAGDTEVFVLGGAGVFAEALPRASTLWLTQVDQAPADADTFFPRMDDGWTEVSRRPGEGYEIVEYRRV